MKNLKFSSSAAISAHKTHHNTNTCRALPERLKAATEAMVKVVCVEGSNKENWRLSTFKELKERLKGKSSEEILDQLDAVDVLTLGCKSDPVSVKDVDDKVAFTEVGYYKGALKITDALKYDEIDVPIQNAKGKFCGTQKVCRWAYIPINENKVSNYFDRKE